MKGIVKCNLCGNEHGENANHRCLVMTQPKTIKVRISVAVWPDGTWASEGYRSMEKDEALIKFIEDYEPGYQLRWIEAEAPAYDEPVVTGEVVR